MPTVQKYRELPQSCLDKQHETMRKSETAHRTAHKTHTLHVHMQLGWQVSLRTVTATKESSDAGGGSNVANGEDAAAVGEPTSANGFPRSSPRPRADDSVMSIAPADGRGDDGRHGGEEEPWRVRRALTLAPLWPDPNAVFNLSKLNGSDRVLTGAVFGREPAGVFPGRENRRGDDARLCFDKRRSATSCVFKLCRRLCFSAVIKISCLGDPTRSAGNDTPTACTPDTKGDDGGMTGIDKHKLLAVATSRDVLHVLQ